MRVTFRNSYFPVVVVLLALSACGEKKASPTLYKGLMWEQFITAGHDSFMLGRYETAQTQYRKAFNLALLHDSASGLEEAGYNLAVTQLAENRPQQALKTIQTTRKAVLLRKNKPLPYLLLVEAAAYDRLGYNEKAEHYAEDLLKIQDIDIAARAALILGVSADQLGDEFRLKRAIARLDQLKKPLSPTHLADWNELRARLLKKDNPAQAIVFAEQAAQLRQQAGAYRDMVRALILEARITEMMGLHDKAHRLWLRAAQSACVISGKLETINKLETMNTATLIRIASSITEPELSQTQALH